MDNTLGAINPQNDNLDEVLAMPELNLNNYISYICGSKSTPFTLECGNENEKKPIDDIICHNCSGKIMYKKRRKSGIQCLAR